MKFNLKNKCGDIFDYLRWRGDLSFGKDGMNIIDGLIFASLAYVKFGLILSDEENGQGATLEKIAEEIDLSEEKSTDFSAWILNREAAVELLQACAQTERFRDVKVIYYKEKIDSELKEQFVGMTFVIPGISSVIAFRGTDDSMFAWQEDFNMSFLDSTPGQCSAAEYAAEIARKTTGELRIVGHSKGGNFAVYAGVTMPIEFRDRIINIYNFDGPGFTGDFMQKQSYLMAEPKIQSFVPEASIVGELLTTGNNVTIESKSLSLLQHDMYSWEVLGTNFSYVEKRAKSSSMISSTVNKMVVNMSDEEKQALVATIFDTLGKHKLETTDDFSKKPIALGKALTEIAFRAGKQTVTEQINRGEKAIDSKILSTAENLQKSEITPLRKLGEKMPDMTIEAEKRAIAEQKQAIEAKFNEGKEAVKDKIEEGKQIVTEKYEEGKEKALNKAKELEEKNPKIGRLVRTAKNITDMLPKKRR